MAEIILQQPWLLLLLPPVWLLLVVMAWRRRFKPFGPFLLRLVIAVLIILALAQPVLPAEAPPAVTPLERLVVLVDQSASLGSVGQQALRSEAARLAQQFEQAQILFFADQPLLVDDSLSAAAAGPRLDPEATNLAEALLTGARLLGADETPGRLALLSDGVPTTGDTMQAATQLARQNIPVDVLLPTQNDLRAWHDAQNEVRIVRLIAPDALRQGETYDIEAIISSDTRAGVTLNLTQNEAVMAEDVIQLEPGLNRFQFTATAEAPGLYTFRAAIAAAAGDDRQLQNNSLSAFARVYAPPQILILAEESVQGDRAAAYLRSAGFETRTLRPESLPTRLSELEPYAGLVLIDVPAQAFELEQMIALQEFVRSLGRGLVVTGGRSSYILGQYDDTPLAELLPVTLEPPPREERPPVALLLIVDHSGSMLEQREPATRLTMAKEAAIRATDILGPDDLIGVLMFDNRYEWVVPFQQVNDGAELLAVQQRIARIPGGGGTRILQALEVGIPALIEQESARSRHIVLLTDGKSFDGDQGLADYDRIVAQAVEANITLSTIAIGTGADEALLARLAEQGLGRYHFAETPEELPALTISESDILRSDALQEGDFGVAVYAPHPILRGLFSANFDSENPVPNLGGYLAMTPKPQAEVALQVGPGDPLLTVWGYGLGRVVAWSTDTGLEWASAWRQWPAFSRFWGQVVGYTLPAPDLPAGLQVNVTVGEAGIVTLVADSVSLTGQPVDLARTQATLTTPGGQQSAFALGQVAPGRYQRQLRLPDSGAYQLTVTQPDPDGEQDRSVTSGFVLPYRAEYALPAAESGPTLLRQIAELTGGDTFSLGERPRYLDSPAAPVETAGEPTELWPWFLQVALILWPLEIAWRRWRRLRIQ